MAEPANVPVKKDKSETPEMRRGWSSFDHLRDEVDRLFEDFGRGFFRFPTRRAMPSFEPFWQTVNREIEPVVDVVEKPDGFRITVELPGLDEKNVEVSVSGGMLVIKGEKKEEKEEKDANYFMSERRYGSFQRTFRLPDSVDQDRIDANFRNGVLTVALPKSETAQKEKKIDVKAA